MELLWTYIDFHPKDGGKKKTTISSDLLKSGGYELFKYY